MSTDQAAAFRRGGIVTTDAQSERFWSVAQACERLVVGRSKLYQLIAAGEIRAQKIGRRTVIADSEISRFVAAQPAYEVG